MALTVKVISPGIGFFEIRRCFHVCNKVAVRLRGLMPSNPPLFAVIE